VKPTLLDLETNLVITTTKRVYDVTLRSAPSAQHPHISFFYPDEDAAARAAAAEHERAALDAVLAGTPQIAVDRADTKYKVTGDTGLLPDKVFNDGARTFVQWKMLPAELPDVVGSTKTGHSWPPIFGSSAAPTSSTASSRISISFSRPSTIGTAGPNAAS
jgi:hypothetical protein